MTLPALSASRLVAAALVVLAYAVLCAGIWRRERLAQARAAALGRALARGPASRETLVVHASQTGAAEQLAWRTAQALHGAGLQARVLALGEVSADDLARARTALFIASTCGEGDAPDRAARFVRDHLEPSSPISLAHLQVGVLALGDREFTHFCAFGRRLSDWLAARGARSLFYRIEADALDAAAIARWQHEIGRLASLPDAAAWAPAAPQAWTLVERRHLNPGSAGAPVFHLQLAPPADAAPDWASGDLVQVHVPGSTARPREYSIASTPAEGRVHLLVRQQQRADGLLGVASGWLTRDAAIGAAVPLTLRPHRNFRLGDNAARPLLLVGNGTGLAGLRAHLRSRADAPAPGRNWLVFGERQRAHDFHFEADIRDWLARGVLERADLAFSRDQAERVHVQHLLREQAARVRQWLAADAAIYVCGSATGMAAGVEEALVEIAGRDTLEFLIDSGRYRRDVY